MYISIDIQSCAWIHEVIYYSNRNYFSGLYEDVSNISIRATRIASDNELTIQEGFPFAAFPSLQFMCETGYIVRLWFIGQHIIVPASSEPPQIPTFIILRQSVSNGSRFNTVRVLQEPQVVLNSRSEHAVLTSVMPATVSRGSFNFTRGNFIGIMNPNRETDRSRLSMLYHNNSGPTVHFQKELSLEPSLNLSIYPLLAVETGTR